MFGSAIFNPASLFEEFNQLQRQMDALLASAMPGLTNIRAGRLGTFPPVNVGTTEDSVEVYVFAPGMAPDAFDISLEQNVLSIAGKREESPPEGVSQYLQERFNGEFRRVLTLPEDVDPNQVSATYKNGVLHIHIQRRETSKPRQIEIKA